jgi:hypothetical protein
MIMQAGRRLIMASSLLSHRVHTAAAVELVQPSLFDRVKKMNSRSMPQSSRPYAVRVEGTLQLLSGLAFRWRWPSVRYFLATAIGTHGFVASAVAGFVDTFLVDKLLGGWKPNHFNSKKACPVHQNIERHGSGRGMKSRHV